jgi:hypothetical protein
MDLTRPLAWVGEGKKDRVILDDITRRGLHRLVVARKGEPMEAEAWLAAARQKAGKDVTSWIVEQDGFFILWIVWK